MMAKESCVVSQTENLDDLLRNLNDQYARIERAISLRSANVEFVNEKYESVNQCFSKVIQLMQSQGAEEIEINSFSKSKLEFDTYVDNWLKSVTITRSKSNLSQISRASSKNTYLSSSTKSSSAKRKEAYAKLVIAKMKQKQVDERAIEVAEQARAEAERQRAEAERRRAQEAERKLAEQERIKKEAARELELAVAEMDVWETSSDILEQRYDKLKCDVTEAVPGTIPGPWRNARTDKFVTDSLPYALEVPGSQTCDTTAVSAAATKPLVKCDYTVAPKQPLIAGPSKTSNSNLANKLATSSNIATASRINASKPVGKVGLRPSENPTYSMLNVDPANTRIGPRPPPGFPKVVLNENSAMAP